MHFRYRKTIVLLFGALIRPWGRRIRVRWEVHSGTILDPFEPDTHLAPLDIEPRTGKVPNDQSSSYFSLVNESGIPSDGYAPQQAKVLGPGSYVLSYAFGGKLHVWYRNQLASLRKETSIWHLKAHRAANKRQTVS